MDRPPNMQHNNRNQVCSHILLLLKCPTQFTQHKSSERYIYIYHETLLRLLLRSDKDDKLSYTLHTHLTKFLITSNSDFFCWDVLVFK